MIMFMFITDLQNLIPAKYKIICEWIDSGSDMICQPICLTSKFSHYLETIQPKWNKEK